MMFSLLAEDVYLNLIHDKTIPIDFKNELALSLLLLWEHRSDQNISDIAPTLLKIWTARRKLAPAFGTMMGTSELLMLSMQLDDQWTTFMKSKLGDQGVSQAMEEFLFGISHEQILQLKDILKTKGIPAIGRDEVSKFLGIHIKTDAGLDYRDFYSMYTLRRDNARVRARMNLPGPPPTAFIMLISSLRENIVIRIVFEMIKSDTIKSNATIPAITIVTALRTLTSLSARSPFSRTFSTFCNALSSETVWSNIVKSLTTTL